jgi:hypothetical protein
MSDKPHATPDPLDRLTRSLKAVEEALPDIEDVYRDDPALPEYRDLLHRKIRAFRAGIRRLVERN